MSNWNTFRDEGRSYLALASKSTNPSKFNPTLRYNFAAMGLEKYVMAACMFNGLLPENHTLTDLMSALPNSIPLPPDLTPTILKYENAQQLCSLEDYQRTELTQQELNEFINSVLEFCFILENHLPVNEESAISA